MTTITEFKKRYKKLASVVERERFLLAAKENYKDTASPEMRKFLNKCIKEFNEEVARTKSYVGKSLLELQKIFDKFTTTEDMRQFIMDVKGMYSASKNPEIRKFLNECTRAHNAKVKENDPALEDSADDDAPAMSPHYAELAPGAEEKNSAQPAENTQYPQQAEQAEQEENAVELVHAEYMEQAAQATQSAHAEEPQYFEEETEEEYEEETN